MLLLSAFSVLALLFAVFVEAQVGAVKCGNRWFTGDQLQKTLNEACRLLQSSRQAGTYPHRYKNYEGFDFGAARPPYFEFPMFTSSIYQGGLPGADRIVMTQNCEPVGHVTHPPNSRGSFVGCSGTTMGPRTTSRNCRGPRLMYDGECAQGDQVDGKGGSDKDGSQKSGSDKAATREKQENSKVAVADKEVAKVENPENHGHRQKSGAKHGKKPGRIESFTKGKRVDAIMAVLGIIADFAGGEVIENSNPVPDNENTHRARVSVRNECSTPIYNVSVIHKYSSVYKNTFKWPEVKSGALAAEMMPVQYHHGFLRTGWDWWAVTWVRDNQAYTSSPQNFRALVDFLERIAPIAIEAVTSVAAGAATAPLGPLAVAVAEIVAGAAAGGVASTLFNTESTDGFKAHVLDSSDENQITEVVIRNDGRVYFKSNSGSSSTDSKVIPLPALQQARQGRQFADDADIDISRTFHKVEMAAENARELQKTAPRSEEAHKAHFIVVQAAYEWLEAERQAEKGAETEVDEDRDGSA